MPDEPTPEPEPKSEPKPDHKPPEGKGGKGALKGEIGGIPKKYLAIAVVGGLAIGLYLRQKNKAKNLATVTPLPAASTPSRATDTSTGSSPGGGGFMSYPSFVTAGDLAPQPTPAPVASPQTPQTFTGPVPVAAAPAPIAVADHGIAAPPPAGVEWPAFVGQPVPMGVSGNEALAHYGTLPQANYTTMPQAGGQPVAGLAGEHPFIYG